MKKHGRKMIAPIVITVIFIIYFVGFGIVVYTMKPPGIVCVLGILIPVLLAGVMLAVCIQRIKEIRSGEEDDLSKY